MLFSIVIPTYNRAHLLHRLLLHLLGQTFMDLEIIVVDDGSNDNTRVLISSITDKRVVYRYIENSERGAARNFGLKLARGLYVNYFDSDDLFLPCLQDVADFIIKTNFPAVLYGDIQHVDELGNDLPRQTQPYRSFTDNLLHNNFLACGSVFIKREIALRFPFNVDRRLSSAEDWELWLRLHTQYKFLHFNKNVFKQVHHPERSLFTINPERIEIRDIYFADLILNDSLFRDFFGAGAVNLFVADRYTFVALSWSQHSFAKSFFYWRKSLGSSIRVVTRKRFWAVLKKIILR